MAKAFRVFPKPPTLQLVGEQVLHAPVVSGQLLAIPKGGQKRGQQNQNKWHTHFVQQKNG